MRVIDITKTFTDNGIELKTGHQYVMAEDSEAKMRSIFGDCMGMSYPIESIYRPYNGEDLTGKKIMGWRTGGIGDMYFLSPALRYLKKKYKNCFIRFASGCKASLENLPEIDELYDMPFDAALIKDTDFQIQFQGIIETSNEKSKRMHAVDMFFSYFKIDSIQLPDEDKKPHLVFKEGEINWLKEELKKLQITDKEYVIGIQIETSSPLRNFPKDKMKALIDVLSKEAKVVLIGTPAQQVLASFYKGNSPNTVLALNYSIRQSIILANRYNLIIAPDSFMIQTAGALDKPLIGLYGPFPSEVRMKYFKNAIALEPRVVCSPCFKHDFRTCIKGYPSPCFTQVHTEDVLQAADYFKYKFTGQHFGYANFYMREPKFDEIEKYFLGADKGLCFFPGYFRHPNMVRIDSNQFVQPDISDLSTQFKRDQYPFVLFMNTFSQKTKSVYDGSKGMVRPGGYFIVYKDNSTEQFYAEIKRDVGKDFVLLYSKYDPIEKTMTVVGKKRY